MQTCENRRPPDQRWWAVACRPRPRTSLRSMHGLAPLSLQLGPARWRPATTQLAPASSPADSAVTAGAEGTGNLVAIPDGVVLPQQAFKRDDRDPESAPAARTGDATEQAAGWPFPKGAAPSRPRPSGSGAVLPGLGDRRTQFPRGSRLGAILLHHLSELRGHPLGRNSFRPEPFAHCVLQPGRSADAGQREFAAG